MKERYKHNKDTKSFQRQSSPSGPTSYIKPRRPPPPVPRQSPRPKPAHKQSQRQTNYTERKSTPSLPRKPPPVNYRLYSIPEKEEEIHGEQSKRRKIMSEQKPQYKSSDSLLSKTSQAGLSTLKSDHHGSMPEMSASGNIKIEGEDIANDGSPDKDIEIDQEYENVTGDFSFIGMEPQYASTPVPQLLIFDCDSSETTQVEDQKSKSAQMSKSKEIIKQVQMKESTHGEEKYRESTQYVSVESENVNMQDVNIRTVEEQLVPIPELAKTQQSSTEMMSTNFLFGSESKGAEGTLFQTAISGRTGTDENYLEENVHVTELSTTQQSSDQMFSTESNEGDGTFSRPVVSKTDSEDVHRIDRDVTNRIGNVAQSHDVSNEEAANVKHDNDISDQEDDAKLSHEKLKSSSSKLAEISLNPLKTVDSVGQYFAKPSDLLKRKLKNQQLSSQDTARSDSDSTDNTGIKTKGIDDKTQSLEGTSTKVVKYDEKIFKDIVKSKLQKQDSFDQESPSDITDHSDTKFETSSHDNTFSDSGKKFMNNYKIYDEDEQIIKETIFKKSHLEAHASKVVETEIRMARSPDSDVGYEAHHDFTSVVDFLEVLKIKDEQAVKERIAGGLFVDQVSPSTLKDEDGKVTYVSKSKASDKDDRKTTRKEDFTDKHHTLVPIDIHVDATLSSYVAESRKRKFMPSVPSPLTFTDPTEIQEKKNKTNSTNVNVGSHSDEKNEPPLSLNSSRQVDKNRGKDILRKQEVPQGLSESSPGYSEMDYTTPFQLGMGQDEPKMADSILSYTTPSNLLAKVHARETQERGERSPGYGEMDYTTPSQLGTRQDESEMADSVLSYTTPSKLLAKVHAREAQERGERSPGYGEMDYTTPSRLHEKVKTIEKRAAETEPSGYRTSSGRINTYVVQPSETQSSNIRVGNMEDDSSAAAGPSLGGTSSGHGDSATSLHAGTADTSQKKNNRKLAERPKKPGQIRNNDMQEYDKIMSKPSQDDSESIINVQRIPIAPSEVGNSTKTSELLERDEEKGRPLYTTPSKLLEKVEKREARAKREKFQGYGVLDYRPPLKVGVDCKPKTKAFDNSSMLYTTPSKLLEKVEKREARAREKKPPAYRDLDYTPPRFSGEMSNSQDRHEETRRKHHQMSESLEYTGTTPSTDADKGQASLKMDDERLPNGNRLLQKDKDSNGTRSPTFSEIFDNVRQGTFGKGMNCEEESRYPTISEGFNNVRAGKFGRQVRPSSRYGTFASTTPSMFLKRFAQGDSKTSINEEQCSETSKSNNKKLHERPQKSGQIVDVNKDHNRPSFAGVAPSEDDNEQFLKLHRIPSAPNRVGNSQNEAETNTESYDAQINTVKDDSDEQMENGQKSEAKKGKRDLNVFHSDITAYFRHPSSETVVGHPCKRHRSEPEFFGMLNEWSNVSLTDAEESVGTYDVKSSEYLKTSTTSSKSSDKKQETSLTSNPSFQAFSPGGSTDSSHESEESMLSMESVHMENVIDQTASINQLFWSLYSSHPNLMQKYLDSDKLTPSQYALDSLSELYCDALHTLASGKQEAKERYTTAAQKKRALPHSPTSTGPDNRSFFMEKEVMESQNRKLQMEISTLTTENKLLKEKYNRATAKISDLEDELQETKEEFESVQFSVNQEVSDVQRKSKSEVAEDIEQLNNKITSLVHENEALKSEVLHLETQMQAANSMVDMARQNTDKSKTLVAYKIEVTSLKDEVTKLKSLLEQSERHLHDEENRYKESSQQVINLTEMKSLLQQQVELGGGGNTVVDKQIKSLEKRLRVTEERLHQERSDRANNLSEVEDKLLTENARLQAAEKELGRQLQREKDKNRNLEQKIKDVRNENERLRLQVPFDEASLSSEKYDIPYSTHSSQRHETTKNHDFKHIATQLEQQAGIRSEKDMVCHLWSTREQAYNQLRQWEIMLQDLNLRDNDATEGLKNLRDLKCQYDIKLKQAEEKVEDSKSEKLTFESTYKEQLATLVKERHEAFAKLKTAEDLLEATRSENEILRKNLPALSAGAIHSLQGKESGKESLQIQVQNLESKVMLLMRSNQVMEGELNTLKVQLDSREKALKDVESELDLANSKLDLDKSDDRKQQKIDKLTVQVNSLQAEIGLLNDKYSRLLSDNRTLERDVETARNDLVSFKYKQRESKAGEMADNKMTFSIKEDLEDKTRQVNSLTEEVNTLDTELQQTRQDLYQEQIQCNEYESQMESLQQQFEERGRIIDTISETEKGQLDQYRVLKVTLDSVNYELKEKEGKVKILEVEVSQQRDKLQQLETYVQDSGETTGTKEIEMERDQLKSELTEVYTNMKAKEEEMHEMATEIQQLQQEMTNQKTEVMQLSSEKGELEQHLEEIAEEHDALIQEKAQSEEDIIKLENKLQELVETLENEARKQHENFETQFEDIPPEYRQIAEELDTLRSLLEAKDKELDMFSVKTSRQQIDIEFLQRRIELLHNDNQSNREDIARMTNQLIFKMKEGIESRQLCEFLSGERVKVQKDVVQMESRLEKERSLQTVKQTEMEKSEFNKRDSVISSLETSLQQARKSLQDAEYDNLQLRYKIDTLTEDQRKLTTIHSSLETKMEAERKMYEEKHQEVTSSNHQLDLLQREHDHVLNNLNSEKQVKEKLNNDYQIYSTENQNLRLELRDIQIELENCQRQLKMSEDALTNAKQDKGVMYHEYENMVKRLSEKDQKIIELQTKLDITVADMEKELHIQKQAREMEKTSTERELDIQKEQVTCLSAEMKTKDSELSTFGRALHELDEVTREKENLERELQRTQGAVHDLKILLDSHKKEIQLLQDSLSRQQESVSRTQLEKAGVEDELHRLKESTSAQIQDLNKTIADLKSVNDGEKFYFKDNLSQTQTQIQSLESSLSSAIQSRDKLQVEYRMSQKALEDTKEQLQEETTSRKIAEQRADTLDRQLHESRKERFLTEEKCNQSQYTVSKLERELKSEKEKLRSALETNQDLEATAYSHETTAKSKQEQVEVLQTEVSKLKQILESQKLQLNSKLKKSAQDMTQQMELIELDRNKLSHQNSQLFSDLEKSREAVQHKNKENLKLQEEILQLQDEVKEYSFKVKHAEESKKTEEELQSKLQTKLQDQEEELKKVRNFLTKKAEESGEAEKSVWYEMNKMIQDMSKQMTMHLESQKTTDKDGKDRDTKVIQRYKKQIHDLNTELQTERALHKITASSLQSLEEDCVRLRQQCQAMRRRNNSASDKKYKSRMEAINEIIARSQSQAQAMLSSGNYLDDSLKTLASPRVTFDTSPDNSISSDMSFNSTIAVHNESSPSKPMKSTPR